MMSKPTIPTITVDALLDNFAKVGIATPAEKTPVSSTAQQLGSIPSPSKHKHHSNNTKKRHHNPGVTEERLGSLKSALAHYTQNPPTVPGAQPLPHNSTYKKRKTGTGGKKRRRSLRRSMRRSLTRSCRRLKN